MRSVERGVRGEHPGARVCDRALVEEEVGTGDAQRQHPLRRRPERRGVRPHRSVRAHDHVVVVLVDEAVLHRAVGRARVQTELLEGPARVPDLDDLGARAVGTDVNRQVRVVHEEVAGGRQVVAGAQQLQEVGHLAAEVVRVAVEQQDVLARPASAARSSSWMYFRLPSSVSARAEANTTLSARSRQQRADQVERTQHDRRQVVLEKAHFRGAGNCLTMRFCPSRQVSSSWMRVMMTSATCSGCMMVVGSSSGASLRRSSVAHRPGEIV